jgi:CRISPR/Cas system-associated exonuclease Cas4 (RecB family)
MPTQTDRLLTLREASEPGQIPYCSKSRVKKALTCWEQFNYSYLKGYKEPETRYMRRGTVVHEAIEDYYAEAKAFVDTYGVFPSLNEMVGFLPDFVRWADHTEPYISNFLAYERRRQEATYDLGISTEEEAAQLWLPVAVEAEEWLDDPLNYGSEAIPWMGYADAIYPAATFPEIETDDGVVIVDFKTGKTPNKKYRDEGIYLEGEYYAMLFESEWDVAGVAGYYPKGDDLIVSPLKESRREKIREVVHKFQSLNRKAEDHLPINEQPLCKWGEGQDEQCSYYDMCSSRWGEPLKHADKTREMFAAGMSPHEIAAELDCDPNHVYYAKKKLDLS